MSGRHWISERPRPGDLERLERLPPRQNVSEPTKEWLDTLNAHKPRRWITEADCQIIATQIAVVMYRIGKQVQKRNDCGDATTWEICRCCGGETEWPNPRCAECRKRCPPEYCRVQRTVGVKS